jgi:hypothetical protein
MALGLTQPPELVRMHWQRHTSLSVLEQEFCLPAHCSFSEGALSLQVLWMTFTLKLIITPKYVRNSKEGIFNLSDYVVHFSKR